jgi:non-canonical poly(A) RNA polymerase PAPD5/7
MILDPNDQNNDISGGTSLAPLIAQCFSDAADTLRKTMTMVQHGPPEIRDRQSVLGSIIGGNYESFKEQRGVMDQLDKYYMSLSSSR